MTPEEKDKLRKKCHKKAYKPKSNEDFIIVMAAAGSLYASRENLPLPALIACACGESKYGTSDIYKETGCPFNLQVPPCWKCELRTDKKALAACSRMKVSARTESNCLRNWTTIVLKTRSKEGQKPAPVPFAVAKDLIEAGRMWCEWIKTWPNKRARDALLGLRKKPVEFARNLHRVGFADSKPSKTKKFGDLVKSLKLEQYDAKRVCREVWGTYV